jgi:NAD dependent epimerase/dehydratase family enzyme
MADALLLTGQRALPEKAQMSGFRFRYETLAAALAAIYET